MGLGTNNLTAIYDLEEESIYNSSSSSSGGRDQGQIVSQ